MSSRIPNTISPAGSARRWISLAACATVLFCSCTTLDRAFTVPDIARTPPSSSLQRTDGQAADAAATQVVAFEEGESRRSSPMTRPATATRADWQVPSQGRDTDQTSKFPVARVGYDESADGPRAQPAPVINAAALAPTPRKVPLAELRPPPMGPQRQPTWPVQQVNGIGAAGPAAGHACAACQPYTSAPPSLPTMPPHGGAEHWSKPWQYGPWPSDEYICNGGDNDLAVQVADDWSVIGLHEGDTIGHYDTLDGKVVVEPTNEVCVYAPRFAAVRRVTGVVLHEQHLRSAGVELPVQLAQSGEAESATTVIQPVQPGRNLAINSANRFRDKMRPGGLENAQAAAGARRGFLPFEDFLIIRRGQFDNSEKARLSEQLQAAYTWSHDASLQVVVDNIDALEASNEVGMESVYTYEMPDGKPCLRIVKVASKQNAKPGETVDFTIRFDNLGDRVIGNVTVIDNLNTRLEYVPDSQECSLKAEFSATENEHESSVLRWEITDPMKVGSGGVIRFQCRVR